MDKVIKQNWLKRNRKWLTIGTTLFTFFGVVGWQYFSENIPAVHQNKMRVGIVEYGQFQEVVMGTGSVEPKTTVVIDANEGGTIKEIKAEEGDMVTAGDVLLTLTNESLMLEYMQRETQMVEQINNLRNTRINLHQNLRTTEDQLIDYGKQLVIARDQYYMDSVLVVNKGIAYKEFNESRVNFLFLKDKVTTLRKRINDDKQYHGDQIARIDNSIVLMERNLEMIREKLNEMSVKASISGQLNSFNLEIGQVLQANQTIGRVDVPGDFWLRAQVDQHYLNRLNVGQGAHIEYDGKTYDMKVSKVLSTIENGLIEIYLNFVTDLPENLRRGQNFQTHVQVSAKKETLKLPKGSFFQSSGGHFVYVVSGDEQTAHKTKVKLGRQNTDFYEVQSGLAEGDKVIISSYEHFKGAEKIELI